AAALDVETRYERQDQGSIRLRITNLGPRADVRVLDAYTGNVATRQLNTGHKVHEDLDLERFHGWYDLVITVDGDDTFSYRLAGHVETGRDSFSDPVLGGLATLKALCHSRRGVSARPPTPPPQQANRSGPPSPPSLS